jgi:hypothetical protein
MSFPLANGGFFRKGGCTDPDALAFFTAASITNPTEQAAVCQLVKNLKGVGSTTNNTDVWSDIIHFYPSIGGSLTSHSQDLKLSLDLFLNAGYTISSDGVINTNTTPATSRLIANPFISNEDACFFACCVSDYATASGRTILGNRIVNATNRIRLCPRFSGGDGGFALSSASVSVANADGSGFYVVGQDTGTFTVYRNGSQIHTSSRTAALTSNTIGYLIQAQDANTNFNDSYVNCVGFSTALSVNQKVDLYDSVTIFNTALGR